MCCHSDVHTSQLSNIIIHGFHCPKFNSLSVKNKYVNACTKKMQNSPLPCPNAPEYSIQSSCCGSNTDAFPCRPVAITGTSPATGGGSTPSVVIELRELIVNPRHQFVVLSLSPVLDGLDMALSHLALLFLLSMVRNSCLSLVPFSVSPILGDHRG